MADITPCTLRDLEAFALERCALGLRILSDTSQYEFERKVVFQQSTMTARQCDLLYVGYYDDRPNDRVYADLDYFTGQIVYYDGQKDVNISAASEAQKIYIKSLCFSKELTHVEPFSAIGHPYSAKPSRRAPKNVFQAQNRNRLLLLIKFAYLLTGRVSSISQDSPEECDVRDEFVKLCMAVMKREDGKKKSAVKKEPVKSTNNLGGMSGNSEQATKHKAWTYQPQNTAEGAFDLAIRASKRKFVDLTISDDEAESSMQGPQIKRRTELDTSRASLHPGVGSNHYSTIDEADETGGVSLTNNMIEPSRAPQAGPSPLEQRFNTVTQLPKRPSVGPVVQNLRAERTLQAGPGSLEARFKTVMEPPERHVESLEHILHAEKERAEKAEREARQANREARQAKEEAQHWKGKFKKMMSTKVSAFLDAI